VRTLRLLSGPSTTTNTDIPAAKTANLNFQSAIHPGQQAPSGWPGSRFWLRQAVKKATARPGRGPVVTSGESGGALKWRAPPLRAQRACGGSYRCLMAFGVGLGLCHGRSGIHERTAYTGTLNPGPSQ